MNRRRFLLAFTTGAAGLLVPKTAYFFLQGNPLQARLRHVDVKEFSDITAVERQLEYFWSTYQIKPDLIGFRDEETRQAFERAIAPRRRRDRCRNSRLTTFTR